MLDEERGARRERTHRLGAVLLLVLWGLLAAVPVVLLHLVVGNWRAGHGADGAIAVLPLAWIFSCAAMAPMAAQWLAQLRGLDAPDEPDPDADR